MRAILEISVIAVFVCACNNSKFQESAAPRENPTPAPVSQPQIAAQIPTASPTPGCTTAGTTVAKLLTDSVTNKAPNQIIKYELSMNDCQGVQTPITASEIKFDLNAIFVGVTAGTFGNPLPYTVQSPDGQQISAGSLNVVQGSDLFGNVNALHWHYKTSSPINVASGVQKVVLNVDISNSENHLPNGVLGGPYPPTELISTFLSFGNASPVEQPVTFRN